MLRLRIGHALFAPAAVALLLLAPASGAEAPLAETRSESATVRTTVYFLADKGAAPIGVRRTILRKATLVRQALEALLAGPTADERKAGIITAIPGDARLVSLSFSGAGGSSAVAELSGLQPVVGKRRMVSAVTQSRVITQIARTLIGVSGVTRVLVRSNDRPWDLQSMRGGVVARATDYQRLLGFSLLCGTRSVSDRAAGLSDCFSALP